MLHYSSTGLISVVILIYHQNTIILVETNIIGALCFEQMDFFNYEKNKTKVRLHPAEVTSRYRLYTFDFKSGFPAGCQETDTVTGLYYLPAVRRGKCPVLVLLHGVGDPSVGPLQLLAKRFAKQNVASVIPLLPVHTSRLSEEGKDHFPRLTGDEWLKSYKIAVINTLQVLDWVLARDEIASDNAAVLGLSFGGFIAAISMALDIRVKAGVFIASAGNVEKIAQFGRRRKEYRLPEEEYQKHQEVYRRYLQDIAAKGIGQVTPPINNFLTDPMTYAGFLRGRPVLMLNAHWDEYMPTSAVKDLWEASGKPELRWYPTNHAGIWLLYPLLSRRISQFLMPILDSNNHTAGDAGPVSPATPSKSK